MEAQHKEQIETLKKQHEKEKKKLEELIEDQQKLITE